MKALVALLILLPLQIFAQTESLEENKSSATVSNSANLRQEKTFSLTLSPVGIINNLPTAGISAAWFVGSDHVLSLDYTRGFNPSGNVYSEIFSEIQAKIESWSLNYKYFMSNSLYVKSGINARKIEYAKFSVNVFGNWAGDTYAFSGESTSVDIGIGNQWQFSNFTIGVDWLNISTPAFSRLKSQALLGPYLAKEFRDQKDAFLAKAVLSSSLYLGASF